MGTWPMNLLLIWVHEVSLHFCLRSQSLEISIKKMGGVVSPSTLLARLLLLLKQMAPWPLHSLLPALTLSILPGTAELIFKPPEPRAPPWPGVSRKAKPTGIMVWWGLPVRGCANRAVLATQMCGGSWAGAWSGSSLTAAWKASPCHLRMCCLLDTREKGTHGGSILLWQRTWRHRSWLATYTGTLWGLRFCHRQPAKAGRCRAGHSAGSGTLQCCACTCISHGPRRGKRARITHSKGQSLKGTSNAHTQEEKCQDSKHPWETLQNFSLFLSHKHEHTFAGIAPPISAPSSVCPAISSTNKYEIKENQLAET